jgi:L-lactate dehydrogenase complex protein LldF
VTGIEKVVEKLEDVAPLLSLLPRSATGQVITTYVNMISSPRKPGEKDGPKEVHLVLLDNGRSRVYGDTQLADTLRCIRCAACMNHCPVYTRVGGHTYTFTYPGPIGKLLTPQLEGLDCAGDQVHASSLCGACAEVCPVQIPIPDLLARLRTEAVHPSSTAVKGGGSSRSLADSLGWSGWSAMYSSPLIYRISTRLMGLVGNLMPSSLPMLKQWTSVRTKPKFAAKSLHELAREKGFSND